ncbi:MAG: hypothetical protein SFY56_08660 [Bacteroidota bacterium]|nr:hypothetical protein [Bacteroidota bacterium]
MKNLVCTALMCIMASTISYAQLGGLLNKVKPNKTESKSDNKVETKAENKGDKKKYSDEIISKFERYYGVLAEAKLDEESTVKREKTLLALDIDSAKQMSEYFEKNKADGYYEKQYLIAFNNFNKNFENGVLKTINDYLSQPYSNQNYGVEPSRLNWFKYAKSAVNSAKKVYTGASNLDEINKNIDNKKNEYAQSLVKSKWLICPEQLDYFQQLRFSDNVKETGCVRGKDKFDADVSNTGVYIYYSGEMPLNNYKFYIDGKESNLSLSNGDLEDSNNGSKQSDNGWYKIMILPGLNEFNHRAIIRLISLIENNGLTKASEIMLKSSSTGNSYTFKYNLSKYSGDIKTYYADVKKNFLKTVKLTDTKYSNAAVEKEVIEAYKKHNTINPQYDIGEVKKVIVAGNDWNIYKTKLGLPDYQQTDAYFIVKGKDGNCYSDFRKIRKVYDPVTKKYLPIKVVGSDSKKEISCDLVK